MTRRALIIGGSLGGLFTAHMLRTIGWQADVFERSAGDLASRGAGLGTQAGTKRMLARIGMPLGDQLGAPTREYVLLDRRGDTVCTLDFPRVMTAWSQLYRPLRDGLPAQHYHPGKTYVAAEQDGRSVTAIFADGTRETGDILIAADGPRSTIRPQMVPGAKPEYAGYVAWRGLTREDEIAGNRELLFRSNTYCIPAGELAISYPVPSRDGDLRPGKRDYNVVWYRPVDDAALADLNTDDTGRRHETIPPPLIRSDAVARLKADARELLAPAIADIFMPSSQPIFQPIMDYAAPKLVFGRIALLGDAAFVARPHVGVGVTKAALDGAALADALTANSSIEAALAAYERERLPAGQWAVSRSQEFGACVSGDPALSRMTAAEEAARGTRVIRDNIQLHVEVGEWSGDAEAPSPL
jgi:2-polyprenyl-6-methoxyphenol hydroxylase-like FAD-dependent oxidoreductase